MKFFQGKRLDEVWTTLHEDEKKPILQRLRGNFDELRKIKGTFIGGTDGSDCDDQLLTSTDWAPIRTKANSIRHSLMGGQPTIQTIRLFGSFARCIVPL